VLTFSSLVAHNMSFNLTALRRSDFFKPPYLLATPGEFRLLNDFFLFKGKKLGDPIGGSRDATNNVSISKIGARTRYEDSTCLALSDGDATHLIQILERHKSSQLARGDYQLQYISSIQLYLEVSERWHTDGRRPTQWIKSGSSWTCSLKPLIYTSD
jgi:hypothetical protein